MKPIHHLWLSALALAVFFMAGCRCEGENPDPVDYRDAFTGVYAAHKYCLSWTLNTLPGDTTFFGPVTIEVTKPEDADSSLLVDGDLVPLRADGTYFGNPFSIPPYRFYGLFFRNDSIFINHTIGGLGGATDCKIAGQKQ